ncbi:MAG: glycosyl transferase [Proteobacteria bacterium]|nr:glycosyl transferase [Pseudomonadota bacterium]
MSTQNRPWLSVIFPVHHGEEWVGAALDSLAAQADPGIEIVTIDTSVDNATRKIVESYADRLDIRFVDAAGAEGCSRKMNRGVAKARADHVSWLCQDDIWLPGRTEAVKTWIAQDPEAVLHLAPSAIVDADGRSLGTWRCPLPDNGERIDRAGLLEKLLVQNFVAVVSPVARKDAWLAVGGIDPALWYTGDWELWIKLARHGAVRHHNRVTGGFRIHGKSATSEGSRNREDFVHQHAMVMERHGDALEGGKAGEVRKLAEASSAINADLAAAIHGESGALFRAAATALALGPAGLTRYLNRSRIVERVVPRLWAHIAGRL